MCERSLTARLLLVRVAASTLLLAALLSLRTAAISLLSSSAVPCNQPVQTLDCYQLLHQQHMCGTAFLR
jgi:hypothetical protein